MRVKRALPRPQRGGHDRVTFRSLTAFRNISVTLTFVIQEIKPQRRFHGRILWAGPDRFLAVRDRTMWSSMDHGKHWRHVGSLHLGWCEWLASLHLWSRRLWRRDVHHAVDLGRGRYLLCAYRGFHVVDAMARTTERLPSAWHGSRPMSLCRRGGSLYYGEYRSNPERFPIAVWRSDDGGASWIRAWTFDSVRHVHGVYHDPHDDALWVTTGDMDAEVGLWRTRDDFRSLGRIAGGSQALRVVQLLFTPTHVLFGSDAPGEVNYLYRMNRRSGAIRAVQKVGESVFYGTQSGEVCAFGTAVEPSEVNRSRETVVWLSKDGGESWHRGMAFRKDWLPMRLFQYGQVLFPAGPGDGNTLWLTPYGAQPDQVSLCYERVIQNIS